MFFSMLVCCLPVTFLAFLFYEVSLLFCDEKKVVVPSLLTWGWKTFFIVFSITHVVLVSWVAISNT